MKAKTVTNVSDRPLVRCWNCYQDYITCGCIWPTHPTTEQEIRMLRMCVLRDLESFEACDDDEFKEFFIKRANGYKEEMNTLIDASKEA